MSFRLKLTITIALLIAIAFSIGGSLMIITSFRTMLAQETQALLTSFENTQRTLCLLSSLSDQSDFKSLTDALKQLEAQAPGQWQALSLSAGNELLFLSGSEGMLNQTIPLPVEDQCATLPVSDRFGHGLLIISIILAGDIKLEVLARFDLSRIYNLRNAWQQQYLIIYCAVIGFGILASVILSVALTRHLHRLAVTVRRISGGELSSRSRIKSDDEFGQLSRDFDLMADKLQENINKLEEDMKRQEQFLGAFAHELKTPMTSIIGYAELLRQGNMDENTRMMAAGFIHSEGKRLERLSFKLLELLLLQKDTPTMTRVRLNTYLTGIERILSPKMKAKNIRFVCRAEAKQVVLETDLVKSLLYNLVDNAAKAMDDNGGIIAIHGIAIPGGCQFQVADNGRGMEPEELSRITEAFYRVDKARSRSQGGAGLGLALCKQIVELHNGSIQFASIPGKGTRVTVTLYGKERQADA